MCITIKSFATNIKQCVTIDNNLSQIDNAISGLLQGLVCTTMLCNIYANDMPLPMNFVK